MSNKPLLEAIREQKPTHHKTMDLIKNYCKKANKTLLIKDINLNFYNEFENFLIESKVAINKINLIFRTIKYVCRTA